MIQRNEAKERHRRTLHLLFEAENVGSIMQRGE